MNMMGLGLVFRAQDLASAIIRRIERNLGMLGDRATKVGAGLGVAFGGTLGVRAGVEVGKGLFSITASAGQLEFELARLKGEAEGAGANFLDLAKNAAFTAGLTSRAAPIEAVQGMRELAKAGLQANEVLEFLPDTIKMTTAAAGEMKMAEVARYIAQVRSAFGGNTMLPSTNLIINATAKAANQSLADISEIPGWISRVIRGSHGMNQEFTDTLALLSRVRQIVTSPETAATSSAMVMQALSGAKKAGEFERVTGVAIRDAQGREKAVLKILAEMDKSPAWQNYGKTGYGKQTEFLIKTFGSRNVNVIAAVIQEMNKGVFDSVSKTWVRGVQAAEAILRDYRRSAEENIIERYLVAQEKTVGGLLTLIETKWTTIKAIVGDMFLPVLKEVTVWINSALQALGNWLKELPRETKDVIATIALMGLGLATMTAAFIGAVGAFVALKALLGFLAPFALLLVKPLLIASVLGVGLIAVAGAFYAAWKNNIGGLGDSVGSFFGKIKLGAQVLGQLFSSGGTWGDVHKAIMAPENKGLFDWLMNLWGLIGRLRNFFVNMWEGFVDQLKYVDGPLKFLMSTFDKFLSLFAGSTGTVDENLRSWQDWGEAGKAVGRVMATIANVIISLLAVALEGFIELMQLISKFETSESPIAGVMRMGSAWNAMMEGRFGDAWDLGTDARRLGPLSERFSRLFLGDAGYGVIDRKASPDLPPTDAAGNSYPAGTLGPQSSLRTPSAMPAAAALSAQRQGGAATAMAPVINYTPPAMSFVIKMDGKEVAAVIEEVQRSVVGRTFHEVPAQGWLKERFG